MSMDSKAKDLVKEYLPTKNIMQLATCADNKPWVCNLHYFSDDELNIYWFSEPERRHSLELKENPNVSAVVKVHENTPEEDYVIGITVEGTAEEVTEFDNEVLEGFRIKHNKSDNLIEEVKSGKKSSKLYKLTPKNFVLFSNKDFPGDARQEWSVK